MLQIIKKIRKIINQKIRKTFVINYFKSNSQKAVLLCYVIIPFISKQKKFLKSHQNRRMAMMIAEIFHELGYRVDILDNNASNIDVKKFKESYDLIFGIGPAFKWALKNIKHKHSAYYETGMPAKLWNINEKKRIDSVNKKWKSSFKPVRYLDESVENYNNIYAIIAKGNKKQIKNIAPYFKGPIYLTDNVLLSEKKLDLKKRNWDESRKNIFFHCSRGKIMSGLDLMFDIMERHKDWHLHLITSFEGEEDFEKFFHKYIYETPNIHYYGWGEVGSLEFENIALKCGITVDPVINAGQSGAVLHSLMYGLYPIISENCNIDLPKAGIYLKNYTSKEIEESIIKVQDMNISKFIKECEIVQKEMLLRYSFSRNKKEMKKIMKTILK